jgi:hypothetical protein
MLLAFRSIQCTKGRGRDEGDHIPVSQMMNLLLWKVPGMLFLFIRKGRTTSGEADGVDAALPRLNRIGDLHAPLAPAPGLAPFPVWRRACSP